MNNHQKSLSKKVGQAHKIWFAWNFLFSTPANDATGSKYGNQFEFCVLISAGSDSGHDL